MWLLGRLLPVMIGHWVPEGDEHWQVFLMMLEIVDILFAPELAPEDVSLLAVLIHDHHREFKSIYPTHSILPKMHFLVHMPRLIRQYVYYVSCTVCVCVCVCVCVRTCV